MLDILGAYDHICKIRLLHNLHKQPINLKLVGIIESYLCDRITIMKTNKCILDHLSIQYGIS